MDDTVDRVHDYLSQLQDDICAGLEREDGGARFSLDELPRPGGGVSRPRVLSGGEVIEKAAVNFTHTQGAALPAAATDRRPELAGRSYEAVSVSLIVHPRNPYAPTCHANFRSFHAPAPEDQPDQSDAAWFGGGFDLTPYYGFEEDARHWHQTARGACQPFGEDLYPRLKQQCDEYFHLPHRGEPRGIGGVFFDDFDGADAGGFDSAFAFVRSISGAFLDAYLPILARRKAMPYGQAQRDFQLIRRGRYVEFNLLYDRGTRFGLQAGARVESILASLPPLVRWEYEFEPAAGSEEARLFREFLTPRDWANWTESGSPR